MTGRRQGKEPLKAAATDRRRSLDVAAAGDGYRDGETQAQALARVVAQGTPMNAALVLDATYQRFPEAGLTEMVGALWAQSKAVAQGETAGMERMLSEQMVTLNAIWGELARQGLININSGHIAAGEVMMRLGLKAQAQATRAAEAIAAIQHGPAVFAKLVQNNSAHQQVVQNAAPAENRTQQSGLMEPQDVQRLDDGAPGQAIASDTPVEALGIQHRTQEPRRKAGLQPQRVQRRAPSGVA